MTTASDVRSRGSPRNMYEFSGANRLNGAGVARMHAVLQKAQDGIRVATMLMIGDVVCGVWRSGSPMVVH